MLNLYRFGPSFGLPDASPFVIKVAAYLRMIDVPFELKSGDVRKAPKGKLPFIEDKGHVIADSTFIVDYLRKTYKDLDVGMTAADRALATAFKSMLEEHYYFVMLALRWVDDRGFAVLRPAFAETIKKSGVPALLAPMVMNLIRKQVVKTARAQGMARHTHEEVEEIGIALIDALAESLGDKPYFLGPQPRSIDATVFAFVWSTLTAPFEGRVKQHMQQKPNLVAYEKRLKEQYFKDY